MSSRKLIEKLLESKKIGSRIGTAGWIHLPLVDQQAELFAQETIQLTEQNNWDFIKIMSNGYYLAAAYGAEIEYSTDAQEWAGKIQSYPIKKVEDVSKLLILDHSNPILKREIAIAGQLVKHYQQEVPIIATLFTPLTWIQEFSSASNPTFTQELIKNNKKELHKGLEAVLETNLRFLDQLFEVGIDGVFIASQFASKDILSKEEYKEFCLPYDQAIINHLKKRTWFNVFHVHGDRNLLFDEIINYDVQALNWENSPKGVLEEEITSIKEVRSQTDKLIIGGIDHHHDFLGTEKEVKDRLKRRLFTALEENNGGAFIFAPGCGLPLTVDRHKFKLIQEVAMEEKVMI